MHGMQRASLMSLTLVVVLLPLPAAAQGWDPLREGGELRVIEQRPAELRHEFSFGGGVIPLDAFYTGWCGTASYTFHPSRLLAWEAISGFLAHDVDSGLEEELLERYDAVPTRYERIRWSVLSQLVVKPLYGKWAWFNGPLFPVETFLSLGGGLTRYSLSYRTTVSAGIGLRLHFSQGFSVRLDVKDLLVADPGQGLDQVLLIGLAGSFNFGRPPG